MSRQAMEKAISNIRSTATCLPKVRPYLLEVGDRINDDILGILPASQSTWFGCLVITPTRIIAVGPDGSIDQWSYTTDITAVRFGEGKKKLLGGHEPSYFFIDLADGDRLNFMIIGEHNYKVQVATLAEKVVRETVRNARLGQL